MVSEIKTKSNKDRFWKTKKIQKSSQVDLAKSAYNNITKANMEEKKYTRKLKTEQSKT